MKNVGLESKASKAGAFGNHENLPSVWLPNNGKFDDGIPSVAAVPDTKPPKSGPYMAELLQRLGMTKDDVETRICPNCHVTHRGKNSRCDACSKLWKISPKPKRVRLK